MGLNVVIDINGQRLESSLTLAHLLEIANVRRVLISGARGALEGWVNRLRRHWESMEGIEVLYTGNRADEATVLLASRATEVCLSEPDTKEDRWLIISRREGFQALGEQLKRLGVREASWVAALTRDAISDLIGAGEGVSDAIRDIAERMLERHPTQPLLIGALANTLTELIPELRSAERREELFGSRKFKAICVAVGLKVQGEYIYPSKRAQ